MEMNYKMETFSFVINEISILLKQIAYININLTKKGDKSDAEET